MTTFSPPLHTSWRDRWLRQHQDLWLLLTLFVSLRLFVVIFTRGGGFWLDYSDYWWYYQTAIKLDSGYVVGRDFWSDYPLPFYMLVLVIYKLAALLPTWSAPHLWFYIFFGTLMVLAETANFLLLAWLARRIYPPTPAGDTSATLRPLWIYAGLFGPIYVVSSYLDPLAFFWMLLALVLILQRRFAWSGVAMAVGFMLKVFPILLVPIAFKLAPWRSRALGVVAVVGTLIALNLPFYLWSPVFFIASWRGLIGQPSWGTIWAMIDGYFGPGMIPGNPFDPSTAIMDPHPQVIPWFVVLGGFSLGYFFLWRRPWEGDATTPLAARTRGIVAFAFLTFTLFLLFFKGWSPQFILWLIPFIILLLPTLRGVAYSLLLSALAIFDRVPVLLLLDTVTWPLIWAVVIRTVIMAVLAIEIAVVAGFIAPARWERWRRAATVPALLALAVVAAVMTVRLAGDYGRMQAAQTPYRPLLDRLDPVIGPDDTLVTTSRESYDAISSYWPGAVRVWPREELDQRPAAWEAQWQGWGSQQRIVWVLQDFRGGLSAPWNQTLAERLDAEGALAHDEWLNEQQRLLAYALGTPDGPVTPVGESCLAPSGAAPQLCLVQHQRDSAPRQPGTALRVALRWEAKAQPQADTKLFVQLLNPDGTLAVGRDLPLAADGRPTSGWTAGDRADPRVALLLPETLLPGDYTLITGLYDPTTGARLVTPSGADTLPLGSVRIEGSPP